MEGRALLDVEEDGSVGRVRVGCLEREFPGRLWRARQSELCCLRVEAGVGGSGLRARESVMGLFC